MSMTFSLEKVQDNSVSWPLPDKTLYKESNPIGMYVRIENYIQGRSPQEGLAPFSMGWFDHLRREFHWPDSNDPKVKADPSLLLPEQTVLEWYGNLAQIFHDLPSVKKVMGDFSPEPK